MENKQLLMLANSDWYFCLHWLDRAKSAQSAGYEVHVLAPYTDDKYHKVLSSYGITYHPLVMHRTSLNPFGELKALIQCFKVYDLVQPNVIHTVTIKPNLYMGMVAKLKNTPIISTFAGLGVLSTSRKIKHRVSFFVIRNLLKWVSSNSRYLALFENDEDRSSLADAKAIPLVKTKRVFGAGVETESFNVKPEPENGKRVLFAARLLKDKGLSDLIAAMRIVKQSVPEAELLVAGIFDQVSPSAYSEAEIEQFAADGDITWLGRRSDMVEQIQGVNVVCLPTVYGEGVPRILIEASACGRAIITTPLGGCKDICVNNITGLHVEPNSPQSLANALLALFEDDNLRKKLGQGGRELVVNSFSNSKIVAENTSYYDELSS